MTKNKSNKGRSKSQRPIKNRTSGDVPKPEHFTQSTMSRAPPSLTSVFTTRIMTTTSPGIVTSSVANVNPVFTFTLNDLDNVSAYVGLFDQYRIDAVRFIIKPYNNAIGLVTNSTTTLPPLYVVIDYDNSTQITTAAEARSYDTCMLIGSGESACRTFQPRLDIGAYNGAFTSFANMADVWVDCASPTAIHYGIKCFVGQATAGQTQLQSWIVEREYFLSFRHVSSSG